MKFDHKIEKRISNQKNPEDKMHRPLQGLRKVSGASFTKAEMHLKTKKSLIHDAQETFFRMNSPSHSNSHGEQLEQNLPCAQTPPDQRNPDQ